MPITAPNHRTLGTTLQVSEVLDPARWRQQFAYGIVLGRGPAFIESALAGTTTTPAGTELSAAASEIADELPDDVIRGQLAAALSELEMKTGRPYGRVVCKGTPVDAGLVQGRDYDLEVPRRPYYPSEVRQNYKIDLPGGVVSVERVRLYWYGSKVWEIDDSSVTSSIRLEHPGVSSLHIMPTTGALFQVGALQYDPMLSIYQTLLPGAGHLPDAWSVDYTLGPVTKTGVQGIEAALAQWVYACAALTLLPMAALARTQGVQSASIGIDGLSKSVSLAGPHIHAALTAVCQQTMDRLEKTAIVAKRGLRVRATGW